MKRALSLILALILIIGVIPVSAYAEDTATPTITMTTDASQPLKIGDTFSVTATLSDNPGFASITLTLLWNSNVVKFTGFTTEYNELVDADLLKDTIIAGVPTINQTDGIITTGAKKDNNKNGTLFIANFEVIGYGNCDIKLDRTDVTKFVLANVNKDQFSVNYVDTTVAPLAVSKIADPSNPQFEVYYQIDDATYPDIDGDGFHEVEPGATVDVGVYVKADSAQTMQAFDIYPEWDTNGLGYVSVTSAVDGVSVVDTEMGKENPHFLTNLTSDEDGTNVTIPTTGIQIATMEMEVKDTVIYGTEYPIWIEAATNLAKANDPESVKSVTVQAENTIGVVTYKIYTVHYDDGVGETETDVTVPNDQEKQHGVQLTLSATEPKREGYTFAGWLGSDNVTYEPGDEYNTNADLVLTAQWTRDQVTVTFDMNDHGTQVSQQTIDPGAKATKPTDPTETGWKFIGWYSNKALTNAFDFDAPINANTTIYAKWEIEKYDVTFNMNGHGDAIEEQTIEYNKTASKPTAPTATGYTFEGWYTEAACENEFNFDTSITKATELFAKWTANDVTVTLDANGGKIDNSECKDVTLKYDSAYGDLGTPTHEGYTFDGWYTQATGGEKVEATTTVGNAADHALYAHWTANTYYVKFNANGGKGTMENQKFTYGADKVALSENLFTHDDPNYVFAGWATSSDGEVVYTDKAGVQDLTAEPNGVVELFAIWKQDVYKINYSSNPAEIGMSTDGLEGTYSSAEGYTITTEPTADGYTFTGWSTTTSGVTVSADGKTVMIPKNHTGAVDLTANFDVNQYTITFADTGDATYEPITKNYGEAVGTVADPTKTGYTFAGWSETIPTTMPAKNMTITANWTINQYTITFADTGDTTYEPITKNYGEAVGTVAEPTKTGYTFAGWSETIPTTMPAENKTITATWTEHTYDITYGKSEDVSYADTVKDQDDVKYSDEVTLPKTDEVTKPGYTLIGWSTEDDNTKEYDPGATVSGLVTENGGSITLYPIWTEAEYIVTFAWGDHAADPDAKVPDAIKVTYNDKYPTLPADVVPANGYKFDGWYIGEIKIQTGDTVNITTGAEAVAKYSKIKYTITFDPKGGVVSPKTMDYYVSTDTLTLPTPTWENHTFVKWVVKADEGSWHKNSKFEITTAGNWGNVEVYAQWESSVTTVVESYKYAMDGYVMLRIPTDANANAYTFNGVKMFYTDDGEYKIGGKAVFVTLIPENNGKEGDALVSYVANGKLTDAGLALLKQGNEEAKVIDRTSGRINMNDEIVNIADANAVYQMVEFGGGYYRETQLSIEKRLMADMFTEYAEGDARGTLQDVNEIVKLINAAANETTNP